MANFKAKATTFVAGIWGKLLAGLAIAGVALLAVLKIRQGGADAERVRRQQADQAVRDRVDAVRPPAAGETEKALQEGRF